MLICVVIGSRADRGLLEWPIQCLEEDGAFTVWVLDLPFAPGTWAQRWDAWEVRRPDLILLLGDRMEILDAAVAAHLLRIPIAHIAGGDVTEGSYDDAMRDCISRMATLHFSTSPESTARLHAMGYSQVYEIGNLAVDAIQHGDWKRERPIPEPYVVVSYQAETIDDTVDLPSVEAAIGGRKAIWIKPNPDRGNERIPAIEEYSHADFLNLLYHCEEFIGNSSSMFYEAPFLGVKCKIIGKRQRGRVIPPGDGKATERMIAVLKAYAKEAAVV